MLQLTHAASTLRAALCASRALSRYTTCRVLHTGAASTPLVHVAVRAVRCRRCLRTTHDRSAGGAIACRAALIASRTTVDGMRC
ncbi:hypothetical protein C8R47DRAFT_1104393 [Mycena vitilis]|nr:hypothetical protein C8R47DRAFT_1104393 [Mycena vitilis]